jgi:hypothetical protein
MAERQNAENWVFSSAILRNAFKLHLRFVMMRSLVNIKHEELGQSMEISETAPSKHSRINRSAIDLKCGLIGDHDCVCREKDALIRGANLVSRLWLKL